MSLVNANGEILRGLPLPAPTLTTPKFTAEMSSTQRSKQMDDVVAQVREIIAQVQHVTNVLQALDAQGVRVEYDSASQAWLVPALASIRRELACASKTATRAHARLDGIEAIVALRHRRTATFWGRLRWIVMG